MAGFIDRNFIFKSLKDFQRRIIKEEDVIRNICSDLRIKIESKECKQLEHFLDIFVFDEEEFELKSHNDILNLANDIYNREFLNFDPYTLPENKKEKNMKKYVIESLFEAKENKENKEDKIDLATTDVTKEPEKEKKVKPKKQDQQEIERDIINKFCHKYITLGKIKPAQIDKKTFKFHIALKDNISFWVKLGFTINPKDKSFVENSLWVGISKYKDTKKVAEISQIVKDERLIKILINVTERFYPKPEKKDMKQEFLGESQKKRLNYHYENYVNPEDVIPGMVGKNYYDEDVEVIAIVPFKNWKQLVKYDDSGWLGGKDMYELVDESDYLIAVRDSDGENSVYIYGPDGVAVYESLKENKNINEYTVGFNLQKATCNIETITNNDNNVSKETFYPGDKVWVIWFEDNYFGDKGGYGICDIEDDPDDPNDVWTVGEKEFENNFELEEYNEE
jgi:hypothetical protein